jgi:hypothetical protein
MARAVEVVLEVSGIIVRYGGWLERSEVSQYYPIEACAHDIFRLNVPVHDPMGMHRLETLEQLEHDPQLLDLVQERSRG